MSQECRENIKCNVELWSNLFPSHITFYFLSRFNVLGLRYMLHPIMEIIRLKLGEIFIFPIYTHTFITPFAFSWENGISTKEMTAYISNLT